MGMDMGMGMGPCHPHRSPPPYADVAVRRACSQVETVAHARVPLVKCVDAATRVACDIVPFASLAVRNTRLLQLYGELSPRCRQLVLLAHKRQRI